MAHLGNAVGDRDCPVSCSTGRMGYPVGPSGKGTAATFYIRRVRRIFGLGRDQALPRFMFGTSISKRGRSVTITLYFEVGRKW